MYEKILVSDHGGTEKHKQSPIPAPEPSVCAVALASIGGLVLPATSDTSDCTDPWTSLTGWQHWGYGESHITLAIDTCQYECCVKSMGQQRFIVSDGNTQYQIDILTIDGDKVQVCQNDVIFWVTIVQHDTSISIIHKGNTYTFEIKNPLYTMDTEDVERGDMIVSPMPGIVQTIYVNKGDAVHQGDNGIVIETMKMQHTLTAPRDGIIAEVMVSVGDSIDNGGLLIRLEAHHD